MFRIKFDISSRSHQFDVADTQIAMHLARTLDMMWYNVGLMHVDDETNKVADIHFDAYTEWSCKPEYHFDGGGFINSHGQIITLITHTKK